MAVSLHCAWCGEKVYEVPDSSTKEDIKYRDVVCGPCVNEETGKEGGKSERKGSSDHHQKDLR